jgi:hypothetical protein
VEYSKERNERVNDRIGALLILAALTMPAQSRAENKFLQHNLVSDLPGVADMVDSSLVNPWGIAVSPTSPFWIANNHSGTAKIYDSSGKAGLWL